MSANLLIRADAGPEIGTGHVMRCLALAEPWWQADNDGTLLSLQLQLLSTVLIGGSIFLALLEPATISCNKRPVKISRIVQTAKTLNTEIK